MEGDDVPRTIAVRLIVWMRQPVGGSGVWRKGPYISPNPVNLNVAENPLGKVRFTHRSPQAFALQQRRQQMNRILDKSPCKGSLTPRVQADRIGILEVTPLHPSYQEGRLPIIDQQG